MSPRRPDVVAFRQPRVGRLGRGLGSGEHVATADAIEYIDFRPGASCGAGGADSTNTGAVHGQDYDDDAFAAPGHGGVAATEEYAVGDP